MESFNHTEEKGTTVGKITKKIYSERNNDIVVKIYFKNGYRLIMSFRYSEKENFYRSSINLHKKSARKWNDLVRIDDAHNFKHIDINGHKHLVVSATMKTSFTEEKGELLVKLPDNWESSPTTFCIYSSSGKGPLVICPPFEKLAEQLIRIYSLSGKITKPKVINMKLPLVLFTKPVRLKYPAVEPEIVERISELGDRFFEMIRKKKSSSK